MHGFVCIGSNFGNLDPISIQWKKSFSFQSKNIKRSLIADSYQIEQLTAEKFIEKKIWIDTDDFLCVTDGIILNIEALRSEYKVTTNEELFLILYKENKTFFKKFEGSFVGFLYLKNDNKWVVFNNRTGTKHLFFYQNESYFIFSTDLFTLTNVLNQLKIKFQLHSLAARLMINNGYLLEDITWIDSVRKLRAGEFCEYSDGVLQRKFYFQLSQIKKNNLPKDELIEELDLKLSKSLTASLGINKNENYPHLTTLSGGLDSRMVVFNGVKNGFLDQQLLNFSQSGYADQAISEQIATFLKMPIVHYDLTPKLLLNVDEVVAVSDGMGVYTGCSHVFSVISQLDSSHIGMINTGIIGDTVMGSSSSMKESFYQNRLYGAGKSDEELKRYIDSVVEQYENTEMAYIYNAIFTNESNGFLFFDLIGTTFSPFLSNDFMQFAFSIPETYKKDRNIYIDWFHKFYPESVTFAWETIGGKPTNNQLKRFIYRWKRAIVKRLPFQSIWHESMNPEGLWFERDIDVRTTLDSYFNSTIELIKDDSLKQELHNAYCKGNFDAKARTLTVLAAVKLLF